MALDRRLPRAIRTLDYLDGHARYHLGCSMVGKYIGVLYLWAKVMFMSNNLYVQYGCGLSAPKEWKNFDVSPTLRIQKTPLIGSLIKSRLNVVFPDNVHYGDIIKGLPLKENSCDGIYCSHTLEHLSLKDFRIALKNTRKVMKEGAIFRCIVPDLEWAAKKYIEELGKGNDKASLGFINLTRLGTQARPRGLKGILVSILGNANHLWMWDKKSLTKELENAGFKDIRVCQFNDCEDEMFKLVEDKGRFVESVTIDGVDKVLEADAVAIECRK